VLQTGGTSIRCIAFFFLRNLSMERHITVVVTEHEYGSSEDCTVIQDTHSMEALLKYEWFKSYLRDNGFYCKDETDTTGLMHLDNFVYQYGSNGYKYFTQNLPDITPYNCDVLRVFQEVIGVERLREISKIMKARDKYLRTQEESKRKAADKAKAAKDKKELLKVEKARALLEGKGLLIGEQ